MRRVIIWPRGFASLPVISSPAFKGLHRYPSSRVRGLRATCQIPSSKVERNRHIPQKLCKQSRVLENTITYFHSRKRENIAMTSWNLLIPVSKTLDEWLFIHIQIMWTCREGATWKRNVYNEIYSGNSFECMHMFNDSLDNWRISLMVDRYYLY